MILNANATLVPCELTAQACSGLVQTAHLSMLRDEWQRLEQNSTEISQAASSLLGDVSSALCLDLVDQGHAHQSYHGQGDRRFDAAGGPEQVVAGGHDSPMERRAAGEPEVARRQTRT